MSIPFIYSYTRLVSFPEKEGPFVRVKVPNEVGPELLEILRARALDLWKINKNDAVFEMNEAKVFFTYRDLENDLCYILSDEDLRCALPLFPASLRVFARVKVPRRAEDSVSSLPSPPSPTLSSNKSSTSTQTSNGRSISDIPVHKVVESLVGVLTTATLALQSHVKVNSSASPTHDGTTATASSAERSAPKGTCAKSKDIPSGPTDKLPFIHGRHTCDGCLTTPILGKRFHAVNLEDYDLCATCHDNYKGNEISFEETQLGKCFFPLHPPLPRLSAFLMFRFLFP